MQATAAILEDPTISGEDFKLAMRRLAGGVSIISGAGPDGPLGVTATAVTSLTAEPPSVLCCLNRSLANSNSCVVAFRYTSVPMMFW